MPSSRIAWLDLARAVSIVLVVFYHVGVVAGDELLGGRETLAAKLWLHGNMALVPLRMPLFFAVAGVLAAGAIQRPWAQVLRPRILDLLWPYVLWSMLFAVTAWPRYAPDDAGGFIWGEVTGMAMIGSPYWFIAVLPIFFVLTRLGRSHPYLLVAGTLIAYAVAPSLNQALRASTAPPDLSYGIFQLTDNALWFVVGYVARAQILTMGRRGRPLLGAVLTVGFCTLAVIILRAELPVAVLRGLELLASVSGLIACVALLPLLGRWELLARAGNYLGSRTLVIYLVHPIVINTLVIMGIGAVVDQATAGLARDVLMVPAATILAIAVALIVDAAVSRFGPRWLLKAPGGREMRNSEQARRPSS